MVSKRDRCKLVTERVVESGLPFVYACAGGGSGVISDIATIPGASTVLLGAHMLQSQQAAIEFLGLKPKQFCSPVAARFLAMRAFEQAVRCGGKMGVGCTCALATTRVRRGEDRAYIAVQTREQTLVHSILFKKDQYHRIEQESIVKHAVLHAIEKAESGECLEGFGGYTFASDRAKPQCDAVLMGEKEFTLLNGGKLPDKPVIFPGSFNPLHEGHVKMAEIAREITGQQPIFELSITNVDKPPLDFHEIQRRTAKMDEYPFVVTNAPLFLDKARMFPGATFVCGIDTIERLVNPKYLGRNLPPTISDKPSLAGQYLLAEQTAALHGFQAKFLVFARTVNGGVKTLDSLELPPQFYQLCKQVPQNRFCLNISSSELRDEDCDDCGKVHTDCRCGGPDA